jgi:WhiB family transcriptional regulator, redox-sensing transcriptional regulator
MIFTNEDWRNDAACNGREPELFFPTAGEHTPPGRAQYAKARAVCASCPVRADCLDYAIEAGLDHGMFGGMTPGERRELARRSQVAATA